MVVGSCSVLTLSACTQDGGRAAQAKMEPSRQSVDEVKRVVEGARKKAGVAAAPVRDFNEEDHYMDGETCCRLLCSLWHQRLSACQPGMRL